MHVSSTIKGKESRKGKKGREREGERRGELDWLSNEHKGKRSKRGGDPKIPPYKSDPQPRSNE